MRIRYPLALGLGIILMLLVALVVIIGEHDESIIKVVACASFILVGFSVEIKEDNKDKNES
jgi:hypothetical protein